MTPPIERVAQWIPNGVLQSKLGPSHPFHFIHRRATVGDESSIVETMRLLGSPSVGTLSESEFPHLQPQPLLATDAGYGMDEEGDIWDVTPVIGWCLIVSMGMSFVVGMYAILVSKWMPDTGSKVVLMLKDALNQRIDFGLYSR